jgi:hypothetical protein
MIAASISSFLPSHVHQ